MSVKEIGEHWQHPEHGEMADVECEQCQNRFGMPCSTRKPEEERLSFCPSCFNVATVPLVNDETQWVDW